MKLKKISEVEWEIPRTGEMKVPGKIFASEKLLKEIQKDDSLIQVKNVAMLPGILKASIVMPDAHQGYGFPIGGVAAFDVDKGVISPGGVGYDINCSVRLLSTNLIIKDLEKLNGKDIKNGKKEIIHSLFRTIPSGVGRGSKFQLKKNELDEVLVGGTQWVVEKGYGVKEDYLHTEDNGKLKPCNPKDVSQRAKLRGVGQLGSLGAGNHFLEIQVVDEVFDEKTAKKFGLKKGMITIMVHCGSRGLGHQVASDYIKLMEKEYGFPDFDRELVNAPIKSDLGKKYLSAMNCAANFAFANKQLITHWIREDLTHYFPNFKADVVYDICHNIAKFENHIVNGKEKKVLVMRKGATRSFPGMPVLIPGSMGTSSYVLVGTKKALEVSFGSTAHGAGRVKSRTQARKSIKAQEIQKNLEKKDIILEAGSLKSISEEAPEVYKDVDEVVKISQDAGIGNLVVKLKPLGVIKG
jgi:tRNA-splicing ligase RtcB (3'-phosphate/5'-hydroxy nucleic acid ligase)